MPHGIHLTLFGGRQLPCAAGGYYALWGRQLPCAAMHFGAIFSFLATLQSWKTGGYAQMVT